MEDPRGVLQSLARARWLQLEATTAELAQLEVGRRRATETKKLGGGRAKGRADEGGPKTQQEQDRQRAAGTPKPGGGRAKGVAAMSGSNTREGSRAPGEADACKKPEGGDGGGSGGGGYQGPTAPGAKLPVKTDAKSPAGAKTVTFATRANDVVEGGGPENPKEGDAPNGTEVDGGSVGPYVDVSLTPHEVRAAVSNAPKNARGNPLCLQSLQHGGCPSRRRRSCKRGSHASQNTTALSPEVELWVAQNGGPRERQGVPQSIVTADEANFEVERLRAEIRTREEARLVAGPRQGVRESTHGSSTPKSDGAQGVVDASMKLEGGHAHGVVDRGGPEEPDEGCAPNGTEGGGGSVGPCVEVSLTPHEVRAAVRTAPKDAHGNPVCLHSLWHGGCPSRRTRACTRGSHASQSTTSLSPEVELWLVQYGGPRE